MIDPAASPAPAVSTAEQLAETLLKAGKSKAEVWQALVDSGADSSLATRTVTAVASRYEARCSGCRQLVPPASTTLSTSGEPLCSACALQSNASAQDRRAAESMGPERSIRRCWRCSKPTMVCVDVKTYRWRRGDRMDAYTFRCGACGHGFTGYGGPMPVLLLLGSLGGSAILLSREKLWEMGMNSSLSLVAGVALTLFFLYKNLVWKLHPETY